MELPVSLPRPHILERAEAVAAREHVQPAVVRARRVQVQERRHHRVALVREVVVVLGRK